MLCKRRLIGAMSMRSSSAISSIKSLQMWITPPTVHKLDISSNSPLEMWITPPTVEPRSISSRDTLDMFIAEPYVNKI